MDPPLTTKESHFIIFFHSDSRQEEEERGQDEGGDALRLRNIGLRLQGVSAQPLGPDIFADTGLYVAV